MPSTIRQQPLLPLRHGFHIYAADDAIRFANITTPVEPRRHCLLRFIALSASH